MAHIISQSGAWNDVCRQLERQGIRVKTPDDIVPALARIKADLLPAIRHKEEDVRSQIKDIERTIGLLREQKGLFRTILNWFTINRHQSEIHRLSSIPGAYAERLKARIGFVERLLGSPDLVGARAELDVITILRRLPDTYFVINDVQLRADEYIHFNGKPLQSAQLDHVVVGPAGVFAVETKRWSRAFAASRNYHDPFDQVRRAGYLCHRILSARVGKTRVREIIACQGHLPQQPKDSWVRVLSPGKIPAHITGFHNPVLSGVQIGQICQILAPGMPCIEESAGYQSYTGALPPAVRPVQPSGSLAGTGQRPPSAPGSPRVQVRCPVCRTISDFSANTAGKVFRCRKCDAQLRIPLSATGVA